MPDENRSLREDEKRVIRALERLEKDWSRELTLASMGGALHLCRTDKMDAWNREGVNPDSSIWSSTRILNTGGDW